MIVPIDFSLESLGFVENLTLSGTATSATGNLLNNILTGNDLDNVLSALEGNDTLIGGGGSDTLVGGAGNDWYRVDALDVVVEQEHAGFDTIETSFDHMLAAHVEALVLIGSAAVNGTGNALANSLAGNRAANALRGRGGDDSMGGGGGRDTLVGGAGDDTMDGGAGLDTVSYAHAAAGVSVSLASGTAQAGGSGSDTLSGFERLTGSGFADHLTGSLGANVLRGLGENDSLVGGGGADTLHGGAGVDTLRGGPGNDTYFVDDLGDVVKDLEGNDRVVVSADGYRVPSSIEQVTWQDGAQPLAYFVEALYAGTRWGGFSEPVTVTYGFLTSPTPGAYALGSDGFQSMTPEQEDVVRAALAQWSQVSGLDFVEQADARGADIRFGINEQPSSLAYAYYPPHGDVYIDSAWVTPYVLLHEIGHAIGLKHPGNYGSEPPYLPTWEDARTNTVMSYYGAPVGDLGAFDIAAIQYLYGVNTGARAGNDTYLLSGNEHIIWDGGGTDTVSAAGIAATTRIDLNDGRWSWVGAQDASILAPGQYFIGYYTAIENAIGGDAADVIAGNELANLLYGGSGNDTLDGGAGEDTLIGGGGRDRFDFSTALSATSNVDTLIEFNAVDDTIRLDNDVFTAFVTENVKLAGGAFYAGGAAHDADDRIIYDAGDLYYDADGNGMIAARLFATLTGAPTITAADFFIMA